MDWRWVVGPLTALLGWTSSHCTCHVDVGDACSPNRELLRLLEGQLVRCGPANLHCPTQTRVEASGFGLLSLTLLVPGDPRNGDCAALGALPSSPSESDDVAGPLGDSDQGPR